MLRSDPRYVEAVFDHLEQRHGSTERFLTACGMAPISLARVRETVTGPPLHSNAPQCRTMRN